MKAVAKFVMYLPVVRIVVWLFLLSNFTTLGDDLRNPLAYIQMLIMIMSSPTTWVLVIIGIVGYFVQRD